MNLLQSIIENAGSYWELFPIAFKAIYFLIIWITIGIVILENRNPVKSMAWILVLFSLPIIGFLFYLILGRSKRKERLLNRRGFSQLMKRPLLAYQSQKSAIVGKKYPPLITFFRKTSHAFPFSDNRVELYSDGSAMVLALLKEIGAAKHHIHLEFYIFENDSLGRLIRDLLIDKVRQGVVVRLLYDDVGCWNVSQSYFDEMRRSGIEAAPFLEVRFPKFTSKVNYRNHRKLAVIDGSVAFIGGMNLAYRYCKGVAWGKWRDTHLRIEGQAAYGVQTAFLTDWYITTHHLITTQDYFPFIMNSGSVSVQIVTSEPVGKWRTLLQGLLQIIGGACSYIYLQTPYLLPTDALQMALQTAALSGVDVRIMIPQHADSKFIQWGSFSYIESLLSAGIKIYSYTDGFLHSKLWVVDDAVASVGSANLDFRSLEHNFEANAFVYNEAFAKEVKSLFLEDQQSSTRILKREWRKRPRIQKIGESMIRLLAPLL
ncbi:MAG: cardiolipin synthase [Phocaeicola sp.]